MKTKNPLLLTIRIFFILFALQFVSDAFYKWDGYSYYMKFIDFLPDLSLSFILWTIIGIIFALAFWSIAHVFSGILKIVYFEHIMIWWLLVVSANVFILKNNPSWLKTISSGILTGGVVWLVNKYFNLQKMLHKLNKALTPLVWIFTLLLILSIPFSILIKTNSSKGKHFDSAAEIVHPVQKQPNIILVVMDALTALDMQVYGYHRQTTPFISEWAKDAILFKKVYSSSNWTTPSTMSIMTGQRPWTHRVWYRAENHPVKSYKNSLPAILRAHGYDIYGFVQNNHAHPKTLGMAEFFLTKDPAHTFWIPKGWFYKFSDFYAKNRIVAGWIFEDNFLLKRLKLHIRHPIYSTTVLPEPVYKRFFEQIPKKPQRPFFAWIHTYPPHDLYLPPAPYMGMFGDPDKFTTGDEQYYSGLFHSEYKPERQADVDILRKRYDEFILYSDRQFEIFLSRLAETFDLSNTFILIYGMTHLNQKIFTMTNLR